MRRPRDCGAWVWAAMLLVGALMCVPAGAQEAGYIVVYKEGVKSKAATQALERAYGVKATITYQRVLKGAFFPHLPVQALRGLANHPSIKYVEPNKLVHVVGTKQPLPTGVDRSDGELSFCYDGVETNDGPGGSDLGGVGFSVAVIDTGIDSNHPDLNVNRAASAGLVLSGRGPVWKRTPSMSTDVSAWEDDNGHGTHVAGIIGAKDNGTHVVGVAPNVPLAAIKVLDETGYAYLNHIIFVLDWVAARSDRYPVANLSMVADYSAALNDAADRMVASGIVLCVAAGNDAADASNASPASAKDVLTVSALSDSDGTYGGLGRPTSQGDDDTFATYSNFGAPVRIMAPGTDIESTYFDGTTAVMSGTSMATPHVTGAAALLIAYSSFTFPLSKAQAIGVMDSIIAAGWTSSDPEYLAVGDTGDNYDEPLLNVVGLIGAPSCAPADSSPSVTISAPADGATFDLGAAIDFAGFADDAEDGDLSSQLVWTSSIDGQIGTGAAFSTTLSEGLHVIKASVVDSAGQEGSAFVSVTVEVPITDIAVTEVKAPASGVQGDAVQIVVTVANVGNRSVTSDFTVTLTESPDGVSFPSQTVVGGLAAGASTTLTFLWQTNGGTSIGDHVLRAEHSVTDDNGANDRAEAIVTVLEPSVNVHVGDLDGGSAGTKKNWTAWIEVQAHDGSHNPLSGVSVTLSYVHKNGSGTLTGVTDASGRVRFELSGLSRKSQSVRFEVLALESSSPYDPSANHDPDGDSNGTTLAVYRP